MARRLVDALHDALDVASSSGSIQSNGVVDREGDEGFAVAVRDVAGWQRPGESERQVGWAGTAIAADDRGGFRTATAEAGTAPWQPEPFGAAEYPVQHVGSDDRDDIGVG